ncbi:hypothetical protein lerEdw1_017693 [Lerista edwardsae]|nr:hypothetical protein lerEdw1_017693 [Lerista edwardsae]
MTPLFFSFPLPQLQRFKRSLSLKTILRSKSVENFFLRSNSEFKLPSDVLLSPPDSVLPPSPPPAATDAEHSPRATHRPLVPLKPMKTHSFQEHIFKKHSPCEICHQLIVGNSKQGLRCKTCKVSVHLWCSEEVSHQQCSGKTQTTSFRRNLSSPMLVHEPQPPPPPVTKESPPAGPSAEAVFPSPPGPSGKVDPIYETLRYGTSLAYMNRSSFSSTSESPTKSLHDKDEVTEDTDGTGQPPEESQVDTVFTVPAEGEGTTSEDKSPGQQPGNLPTSPRLLSGSFLLLQASRGIARKEVSPMYSYVSLYKFLPQENNDLPLKPGDRIMLLDDSNEDWWKVSSVGVGHEQWVCKNSRLLGKMGDRMGFFPANFVQRVRPGETVWRCCKTFSGNKEQGQLSLKENQICVGVGKENEVFIKVTSGKKRGLVPADILTEI